MAKPLSEPWALIDMDETLCLYSAAMQRDLEKMRGPTEPVYDMDFDETRPDHINERMKLIKAQPGWWRRLEPDPSGLALLKLLRKQKFRLMILTQGPRASKNAWTEKVEWCGRNVSDAQVTITRDKGLVYGKVLCDDYPPYALRWLEYRPRGLVIMPDKTYNRDFTHPNVVRWIHGKGYTPDRIAASKEEVEARLTAIRATAGEA